MLSGSDTRTLRKRILESSNGVRPIRGLELPVCLHQNPKGHCDRREMMRMNFRGLNDLWSLLHKVKPASGGHFGVPTKFSGGDSCFLREHSVQVFAVIETRFFGNLGQVPVGICQ